LLPPSVDKLPVTALQEPMRLERLSSGSRRMAST
jgi:hypothetical protein